MVCMSQMPQMASSSHLHWAGPWMLDRSPTSGWPQQAGEGEVRLGWGSPPRSHRHCHIPVGCDTLGLFQEAAGLQAGRREGDWLGVPFQVLGGGDKKGGHVGSGLLDSWLRAPLLLLLSAWGSGPRVRKATESENPAQGKCLQEG